MKSYLFPFYYLGEKTIRDIWISASSYKEAYKKAHAKARKANKIFADKNNKVIVFGGRLVK